MTVSAGRCRIVQWAVAQADPSRPADPLRARLVPGSPERRVPCPPSGRTSPRRWPNLPARAGPANVAAAIRGHVACRSGPSIPGSGTCQNRANRQASPAGVASPAEHPDGDQDAERGEDQDRRGGDRGVEVAALELAVDDERQRLRPALDVAGEHDRRAELAERRAPSVMTRPAARAAPASGIVIGRKSWRSEAPSTRAASSRSRSTPAIPVRAERMKNGADTNVWARITAIVVNGIEIPRNSNGAASRPRRPKTSSSASPATDGGSTIGRSTIASSQPLPRNCATGQDERERQPERRP